MAYSKADLELAFGSKSKDFTNFITQLEGQKTIEKAQKVKEKAQKAKVKAEKDAERAKTFEFHEENQAVTGDWGTQSGLEKLIFPKLSDINNYVGEGYDEVPDEGIDYDEVFKVNDKYYYLEINSGAEWVGDWSLRCNVTGTPEIKEIYEITDYELGEWEIKINKKEKIQVRENWKDN